MKHATLSPHFPTGTTTSYTAVVVGLGVHGPPLHDVDAISSWVLIWASVESAALFLFGCFPFLV